MRTRLLLVLVTAVFAANQSKSQNKTISDAEVMRVHRSTLLIDTHNDVPSRTVEGFDIGSHTGAGHTDIARLKEGGVGAQFFAVYVAASYVNGNHSANRTLQMIDTVRHDIVERYPNDFMLATSAKDIEEAHRRGKIAALMGIEGGHAIEDSLRLLRDYYDLGVRYMTLTHSNTNDWADSSGDIDDPKVKHHGGLTDFGKQVVREMNRLGMMVDISHVADKTFWDALDVSKAPIFASHSSCRALTNHARNMTDDMIVALAKKGGVVQVNFYCGFISQKFRDYDAADTKALDARMARETAGRNLSEPDRQILSEKLRKEMGLSRATLADVVDHIDHIRKIAGIDAIGIGGDFDGVSCTPVGLDDVSKYPNLTRALLEKGYSADDIRKIYGGNFLRVMRAVEAAAGK
ncbi:MAG TPA: dipeptidase [Bryobacteraceae bacterium]|jgi:membrane dipeptidase|nr:dipeptidase [Bryobacteraceae bacterium]